LRVKISRKLRLIQNTLIDQFQKPDGCLVAVLKTFFVEMIIAVFPRMIRMPKKISQTMLAIILIVFAVQTLFPVSQIFGYIEIFLLK